MREMGTRWEMSSGKKEKGGLVRSEGSKPITYPWQAREQTEQADGGVCVFTSSDPRFL